MRWVERQDALERQTLEDIEEIADFFGVEVPFYPEVYWVGRRLNFEQLGLSENYESFFEEAKKDGSSVFLSNPKVILIGRATQGDLAEEAAHFVHLTTSKIRANKKNFLDLSATRILVEMFGFLGSRVIVPNRINPYAKSQNYPPVPVTELAPWIKKTAKETNFQVQDVQNELIHFQGYGLAERIWYLEKPRGFCPDNLRKIFLNGFSKPLSATLALAELRKKYWPQELPSN